VVNVIPYSLIGVPVIVVLGWWTYSLTADLAVSNAQRDSAIEATQHIDKSYRENEGRLNDGLNHKDQLIRDYAGLAAELDNANRSQTSDECYDRPIPYNFASGVRAVHARLSSMPNEHMPGHTQEPNRSGAITPRTLVAAVNQLGKALNRCNAEKTAIRTMTALPAQ